MQEGTGGALPKPYKMTSTGILEHVSDTNTSETLPDGGMNAQQFLVGRVLTVQHRAAQLVMA